MYTEATIPSVTVEPSKDFCWEMKVETVHKTEVVVSYHELQPEERMTVLLGVVVTILEEGDSELFKRAGYSAHDIEGFMKQLEGIETQLERLVKHF